MIKDLFKKAGEYILGEFVIVVNRNEDFCYKISYTSLSCVCVRKRGREEKERETDRQTDRER